MSASVVGVARCLLRRLVGGVALGVRGVGRRRGSAVARSDALVNERAGTIIGTGPVVGDKSTYSSGSPSGVSSATTSTATRRARSNTCKQSVAAEDQLLDLLAGQLAPAGQLRQHPLAVGASLVDHLAALLLGERDLTLGVGGGIGALA